LASCCRSRRLCTVSGAPQTRACVSAPADTSTLSPSPPHPSLAVSETTSSETRVPPCSPPSSRRRRSPALGAPPPKGSLSCQRPLTCLLSHHSRSTSLAVSKATISEPRAPPRSLPSSRRRLSPASSAPPPAKCLLSCQRPLTRLLSHHPHPTPRSQSHRQQHRRRRWQGSCCRAQGHADHYPEARATHTPRIPSVNAR
jgi:hypothetical protein